MNKTNALRIMFDRIARESGGRFSVYNRGDLARACAAEGGVRKGASAEDFARAALGIVARWASRPKLSIGDVVVAEYYGSIVIGRIRAYDGSGYVYLDAVKAGSLEHSGRYAEADAGICLSPAQRRSMFKIGRKAYKRIEIAPFSCLGGADGYDTPAPAEDGA